MRDFYKLTYRKKKAKLREHNYSMSELADWGVYFEKEGRKYGLIKEFK